MVIEIAGAVAVREPSFPVVVILLLVLRNVVLSFR